MKALARDPWVQILSFIALLSGGMAAHHLTGRRPKDPPATPPAQAMAGNPHPQVAVSARPGAPGSSPVLSGPSVRKLLEPRTPGRWIVDARQAPDADTASLPEAVFSAKNLDVIMLRPGVYQGALFINKSLTLIGQGAKPEEVRIESSSPRTIAVTAGHSSLKNLTIDHSGPPMNAAVEVVNAGLEVSNVLIRSSPQTAGVGVINGSFSALAADFQVPELAVVGKDGAKVSLARCQIRKAKVGVKIEGEGSVGRIREVRFSGGKTQISVVDKAEVDIENSNFEGAGFGLYAERGSRVKVTQGAFSGMEFAVWLTGSRTSAHLGTVKLYDNKTGVYATGQASAVIEFADFQKNRQCGLDVTEDDTDVKVRNSVFSKNGSAICASEASKLDVSDSSLFDNSKNGLSVIGSGQVSLARSTVLRSGDNGVMASKRARIKLDSVQVRGSGSNGIYLADGSTAILEEVKITESRRDGIDLEENSILQAVKSEIVRNKGCGVNVGTGGGSARLSNLKLTYNECGIAFYGPGSLEANRVDFRHNRNGPLFYLDRLKEEIYVSGSGNIPQFFHETR